MPFDYDKPTTFGGGNKVAFQYAQLNIATSQASVAVQVAGQATVTQIVCLYDGYIMGCSARANAVIGTSTIRFIPTINGVTITAAVATNVATSVRTVSSGVLAVPNAYDTTSRRVTAGDAIGVKASTTASYAPATLDWTVAVWLEV